MPDGISRGSATTGEKAFCARDLDTLLRRIYRHHGIEKRVGNLPAKHWAQRKYDISRTREGKYCARAKAHP